jgi:putative ABC transport system permease protein
MALSLPEARYGGGPAIAAFYRHLLPRLAAIPGVEAAAAMTGRPMIDRRVDAATQDFALAGRQGERDLANANLRVVTPSYFHTAGTRLLRGRGFVEGDDETRAPVGIVNQTMARRFWPGADAIGRRIVLGSHYASPPDDSQGAWVTVVGVVADAKQIRIVEEPVRQEIFFPLRQHAAQGRNMALLLRSGIDPDRLADAVRRAVLTVDPEQPIFAVYAMDQVIADSFGAKRLATLLLGLFALVAAALASVGLYAVLAYAVAQRRHEIGVRMALGARRADILRMVLREGSRLALAGVAAGLAGALLATRLLTGMLFAVAPTDPATFAAVSALLAAVALLASYLPARRATAVDPAAAFKQE